MPQSSHNSDCGSPVKLKVNVSNIMVTIRTAIDKKSHGTDVTAFDCLFRSKQTMGRVFKRKLYLNDISSPGSTDYPTVVSPSHKAKVLL
jgi:hypothetical protein